MTDSLIHAHHTCSFIYIYKHTHFIIAYLFINRDVEEYQEDKRNDTMNKDVEED